MVQPGSHSEGKVVAAMAPKHLYIYGDCQIEADPSVEWSVFESDGHSYSDGFSTFNLHTITNELNDKNLKCNSNLRNYVAVKNLLLLNYKSSQIF